MFASLLTLHNLAIFFETLVFVYVSYLSGGLFLRWTKIGLDTKTKNFVYSVMLGFAIFGFAGFVSALFGVFGPNILRTFFVFVLFLNFKTILSHIKFLRTADFSSVIIFLKNFFKTNPILKVIIFLWLFSIFLIVFVPITGHDTLDYHLPIIFDIIDQGKLTFSADVNGAYEYLPVFVEIIYAVPLAIFGNFSDPFIFQLLQYSALLLFLLLVCDFLKHRIENKFLNIVSIFFILSIFDFQREVMHGGYIDVFLFLFGIASALLIIENYSKEPHDNKMLNLSAVFLGFAFAMKYMAFFFAVINLVFLLAYYIKKRSGYYQFFKRIFVYGLIVFAIGGFWYVKNLVVFDNPVYPMFSDNNFKSDITFCCIVDRTMGNLFLFPFIRFGQWFLPDQVNESSSQLVVFGYFTLMYLLMAFRLLVRKKFRTDEILLFFFIQIYLGFLFFISHHTRYMLPGIIMVPLLLVLLLDEFYNYLKEKLGDGFYRYFMKVTFAVLRLAFIFVFLANFHYFYVKYNYLIGVYDKTEYINEIGGM